MNDAKSTLEKHQYDHHVVLKRRTSSAIFAEERHERPFQYPMHDHVQACFLLTDNCVYREQLGTRRFIMCFQIKATYQEDSRKSLESHLAPFGAM